VSHCTETLAMVVDDGTSCVAFAADTGPTELLWSHLADRTNVRAVFLECSFPESLERLATACGHLSPATFATQVARLPRGVRTLVVHRKAAHTATIAAELAARALPGVELAEAGPIYDL
jgi:3',5'-cyclic-nucleotide phosphodiesterase